MMDRTTGGLRLNRGRMVREVWYSGPKAATRDETEAVHEFPTPKRD